jgi:hypothetical protein
MIIYVTGEPGSGKTFLLKSLSIPGYDLDDIYNEQWKHHRKWEIVQKGAKKKIDSLIEKHKNIVFVGYLNKKSLGFNPDYVFILYRDDYEQYYRQKLIRDFTYLIKDKKEWLETFKKAPVDELKLADPHSEILNFKTLKEFIEKNKIQIRKMKADFPEAKLMKAKDILNFVKTHKDNIIDHV